MMNNQFDYILDVCLFAKCNRDTTSLYCKSVIPELFPSMPPSDHRRNVIAPTSTISASMSTYSQFDFHESCENFIPLLSSDFEMKLIHFAFTAAAPLGFRLPTCDEAKFASLSRTNSPTGAGGIAHFANHRKLIKKIFFRVQTHWDAPASAHGS